MADPLEYSKLIDYNVAAQLLCAGCYFVSSWWLLSNYYAGFMAIFSALLFLIAPAGAWYVVRRSVNRTFYGAVLGVYSVLVATSLQCAIFWGQYSQCNASFDGFNFNFNDNNHHRALETVGIQCDNTSAMTSLCTFASLLFVCHVVFGFQLLRYKDDILGSQPLDEGIPSRGGTFPGIAAGGGGGYQVRGGVGAGSAVASQAPMFIPMHPSSHSHAGVAHSSQATTSRDF